MALFLSGCVVGDSYVFVSDCVGFDVNAIFPLKIGIFLGPVCQTLLTELLQAS